jgi:hypothetical protein
VPPLPPPALVGGRVPGGSRPFAFCRKIDAAELDANLPARQHLELADFGCLLCARFAERIGDRF